jgi:hypothetical protein
MFIDAVEIFRSFKAWRSAVEPNTPTPQLDLAIQMVEQGKAAKGITRTRYVRTREMAAELKRVAEYDHMNKLSSKSITRLRGQFSQSSTTRNWGS